MGENRVFAVLAVLLVASAVFVASGTNVEMESLILPDFETIKSTLLIFLPISLLLLAGLMIKWSSPRKTRRLLYWFAAVFTVVVLSYVLKVDYIVFSFLLAAVFGTILPIMTEDPCKQGIWYSVSSPRTLAVFLVLGMLILYGAAHLGVLQPLVVEKIIDLALISSGGSGPLFDVNQMIPPGITPEERGEIIIGVQQSTPNWDQLSEEQRQQIIDQSIQQYLSMKDAFRRALEKGVSDLDREQLREMLKQQIMEMPVVTVFITNTHYLFALMGAMWYSIISLFAEWIAFILGAVLGFARGRRKKQAGVQN